MCVSFPSVISSNATVLLCVYLQAITDSRGHDEVDRGHQSEWGSDEDHLLQGNPLPHL